MVNEPKNHGQKLLRLDIDDADAILYEDMQAFGWSELAIAVQERACGTVFWTTDPIDSATFYGLDKLGVAYLPRWHSLSECTSVYISLSNKRKSAF